MSLVDEFYAKKKQPTKAPAEPPVTASRPLRSRIQRPETFARDEPGVLSRVARTADDFVRGVADAVTFGYADEFAAWADEKTGLGRDYKTNLKAQRQRDDEGGTARFVGQISGSLAVPIGSGVKTFKGVLGLSAAQGALYGTGSADGVQKSRTEGAIEGAAWGLAGGAVIYPVVKYGVPIAARLLTKGKAVVASGGAVKLPPKPAKTVPKVAEEVTPVAPKAAAVADEASAPIPQGAVTSASELVAGQAMKNAAVRLNKMTQAEAAALMERVDAAEKAGDIVSDPHYRSMLDVGLNDEPVAMEQVIRAVNEFEGITEDIRVKAAGPVVTQQAATKDIIASLKEIELDQLANDAMERSAKGMADARLGQHLITLSGVRFTKARDQFLDLVRQGDSEARLKMTDMIVEAMDWFTKGATIRSNQGRALNTRGSKVELLLDDLPENAGELTVKTARERVDEALKELGDDGVADLLGRLRSLDDLDGLVEVLNDPAYARQFTTWQKAQSSLSTFLRSNAFTPMTGIINATSAVIHDFFRNDLGRLAGARMAAQAGRLDEAAGLRLEREVGHAVYWEAQKAGFNAFISRIKWEFWNDVENISSVGWGSGKVAQTAKKAKVPVNASAPRTAREAGDVPRLTITKENLEGLSGRVGEGAFGSLIMHAAKAGAVAVNTVDALGTAMGKTMIGAVDDWGSAWVRVKETQVQNARFAVKEGLDAGLTGDDLATYVSRRVQEINEMPPAEVLDRVEDAILSGTDLDSEMEFLVSRDKAVGKEADRVLFMDSVQTVAGRWSVAAAEGVDKAAGLFLVRNTLIPFVRTPIRIFERGLAHYTPWGHKVDEVAKILAAGGPEATIVRAQMQVGTMGIMAGAALSAAGVLNLTNGGWDNTKGLDEAPPNSLKIGDTFVEIGRLDPFALTLALGGLIGQSLREGFKQGTEYDAYEGIMAAAATALVHVPRDAFLSKSYLTGVKEMVEMVFGRNGDTMASNIEKHLGNVASRFVPLGGLSRQLQETLGDSAVEAVSFTDQMLRTIPGAGLHMPVRRDILGDPIKSREMGLSVGRTDQIGGGDKPLDAVKEQLREFGMSIQNIRKADPAGFDLSAKQLDRLREIRGHTAVNEHGQTMRQALAELFADSWFQELPQKEQKRKLVMDLITDFNKPARELLMAEDPTYASKVVGHKALKEFEKGGASHVEAVAAAEAAVQAEGLPDPELQGFLDYLRQ